MTAIEEADFEEEKKTCPSVAIIVLNWENYKDTSRCLRSVREINYSNYDVFVVDNGSSDESGKRIESEFSDYTVIFNEENIGFAAGNNRGITAALKQGFDYILLLNEDTVVSKGFLTPLVETMEENDNAAIVGGIITDFQTGDIQYAGAKFHLTLGGVSRVCTKPKGSIVYGTGYIPGALMLLSPEFLKRNGLLNEDYFFGMEDVDACWVAHKEGRSVMVNRKSKVRHKGGITHEANSRFWTYHQTRNRLQFATKRLDPLEKLAFYPLSLVMVVARLGVWLTEMKWSLIHIKILSIFDFLLDNQPKQPDWFE